MKFILGLSGFGLPAHELTPLARAAEQAGFDGVTVPDHVVVPVELLPRRTERWRTPGLEWPDCQAAQAFLLGATSRIRVISGVLVLPVRHPLLVAKAVQTMATLAPGRVVLGVGAGWFEEEFEVLGASFATRGARTDEAIEIIRRLGRDGALTWRGRFYDIPEILARPVPPEPAPIVVGGSSEAAMRRAAGLGDGYMSQSSSPETLVDQYARVSEMRAAAGREADPFEFIAIGSDAHGPEVYAWLDMQGIGTAIIHPFEKLPGGVRAPLAAKLETIEAEAERLVRPLG